MRIEEAKQLVLEGGKIDERQALGLANHPDKEALYEAAHQITRHFMGDKFDTCSIINAKSGNCSEDCKWCAQSVHHRTRVRLYPLLPAAECVRHAVYNRRQGIGRFALVTSGKRVSDREITDITDTVRPLPLISGDFARLIPSSRKWRRSTRLARSGSVFVAGVLLAWARRWRNVSRWLAFCVTRASCPFP